MPSPLPTFFRPTGGTVVLSQTQEEEVWSMSGADFIRSFGQTIKIPFTGNLTKVVFKFKNVGTPLGKTITLEAFPTSAGAPVISTPLGTATLSCDPITTEYTEIAMVFSSPIAVTANDVIALIFSYPEGTSVNLKESFIFNVGGGYADGSIWYYDSGTWWEWEEDFYFKVYMTIA